MKIYLYTGKHNFTIYKGPNLHWPDTMFTYVRESRFLFTCDFQQDAHYCFLHGTVLDSW